MCKLGLAFAVLILASCSGRVEIVGDPKERFREYVSKSFAVNSLSDREELKAYLVGEASKRMEALSDDRFRKVFIRSKKKFLRLRFREFKKVSEDKVNLTYELTYVDHGSSHDARVTNKKLCYMVKKEGNWYIENVKNIKMLVEYKNEMTLP